MKKDKAFTLLEIMITAVLFSLIFIATLDVLSSSRKAWNIGSTMQDLQVNLSLGMNQMIRELENSSRFALLIPGESDVGAAVDTARFMVPIGYDGSANIIWGADGFTSQRIQYRIDNDSLIRERLDSSNSQITTRRLANFMREVRFLLASDTSNSLAIALSARSQASALVQAITAQVSSVVRFNN